MRGERDDEFQIEMVDGSTSYRWGRLGFGGQHVLRSTYILTPSSWLAKRLSPSVRDRVVCGLIGVVLNGLSAQVSQGSLQKLCCSKQQTQKKNMRESSPHPFFNWRKTGRFLN